MPKSNIITMQDQLFYNSDTNINCTIEVSGKEFIEDDDTIKENLELILTAEDITDEVFTNLEFVNQQNNRN